MPGLSSDDFNTQTPFREIISGTGTQSGPENNPVRNTAFREIVSGVGTQVVQQRFDTGNKPYKCNICHGSFTLCSNPKTHLRLYTGEKPYKCRECEICLRLKTIRTCIVEKSDANVKNVTNLLPIVLLSHLKNHYRLHSGEKSNKCNDCGRSFPTVYSLESINKIFL
ncbi:hypothetical protein U0070_025663 [Myodes glareolus]|uniref:C2H2-type domain-containing protein n=1 Tax=Myodes glareolus TaxID=447135 RepID=A0AAW0I4D8_MYOGA